MNEYHGVIWKPPRFLPPSLPPSFTFIIKAEHTRRCRSSRIIENEGEAHLVLGGGAVDDLFLVPGGVVGAAGLKEGGRKGGR